MRLGNVYRHHHRQEQEPHHMSTPVAGRRDATAAAAQKPVGALLVGVAVCLMLLARYQREVSVLQSRHRDHDNPSSRTSSSGSAKSPEPRPSPSWRGEPSGGGPDRGRSASSGAGIRSVTESKPTSTRSGTKSAGSEKKTSGQGSAVERGPVTSDAPVGKAAKAGEPGVPNGTMDCGCPRTCNRGALLRQRNGITCRGRITYLMSRYRLSEADACAAAAREGDPCGFECHPAECDAVVPDIPATVVYAEDMAAPDMGLEGTLTYEVDCGCPDTCDTGALQKTNRAFSCIGRIKFFMRRYQMNESDACTASSREREPCGVECDPSLCRDDSALEPIPFNWTRVAALDPPQQPFVRHDGVVVVTKVLWPNDMPKLKQMLCLFHAAYNRHVNYDIVVFTTVPWTRREERELQAVVPRTKLSVVRDSPSLQDQLASMSPDEIRFLQNRCGVKEGENLTWFHHCTEPGYNVVANLGYSWQSEFRAYHIWRAEVLAKYKYMIWMDGDSFCTKPWKLDPLRLMVENDLVLMTDNFPQGFANHPKLRGKMERVFNRSICAVHLSDEGCFSPKECTSDDAPHIGLVHGFMHVTNLEFYRNATNLRFLEVLVSEHRFSRQFDDQLAVTAPAAIVAPERAWDMRRNGLNLGIHHNGRLDGKEKNVALGYTRFWEKKGRKLWNAGREMCANLVVYRD